MRRGASDAACSEMGRDPATLERTSLVMWKASEGLQDPWFGNRYGWPLAGEPEEIDEVFRGFARRGFSHLQVGIFPNSLEGVEAFAPVLEALDRLQ